MAKECLNELAFRTGSTKIGKLPPILFITNKNTPTVVDLTDKGTISTRIANRMPNHISAENKKFISRKLFSQGIKFSRKFSKRSGKYGE